MDTRSLFATGVVRVRLLRLICLIIAALSCAPLLMADLGSAKSFVILSSAGSVTLRNLVNITPVVIPGAASCPGAAGCTMRVGGSTLLTGRGTAAAPDLIAGDVIARATASQGLNCAGLPPGSAAICFGQSSTVTGACVTGGGGVSNASLCAKGADTSGLNSEVATLLPNAGRDAAVFSAYLASLPASQTLSAINMASAASRTLTFSAGLTVASVPSIVLGSSSILTISAPSSAMVVINVGSSSTPGVLSLKLASSVLLAGGIKPDRVVFNILGGTSGQSVQMADNTRLNGTLMAPQQGLITGDGSTPRPMTINGALLFGQSVTIGNNVNVNFYPLAQIVRPGDISFIGTVDVSKLPPPTANTVGVEPFESDDSAPIIEVAPGQPGPPVFAAPLSPGNLSPTPVAAERAAGLEQPPVIRGPQAAGQILVKSFPAMGNVGNYYPADTAMAVGPNVIVEMVNSAVGVYDRTTGEFKRTFDLAPMFKESSNPGFDPQVVYDPESGHFIAAHMALANDTSEIHYAITADPEGEWKIFAVRTHDTVNTDVCMDFPRLGYSTNKIMLAWNNYKNSRQKPTDRICSFLPAENFTGAEYILIDKTSALTSNNPISDQIGPDTTHFSITPVHSLSPTSVQYAAWHPIGNEADPGRFPQTNFDVIAFTGSGATFNSVEMSFDIGAVTKAPDAHQPAGGNPVLLTWDTRLKSAVWQNENVWATFNEGCTPTGDTVMRACVRLVNASTLGHTLVQHAQVQLKGEDVYYAAVTLNSSGDVFLGFTQSSDTRAPAAAVAAAPRGDLTSLKPGVFQAGSVYNVKPNGDFNNRWGDYSAAVPDPVDPRVVWVAQEYGYTDGNWKTAIGRVYFGSPVTITYHQTGACNGFADSSGGHFVGPNQAYVIFGIETVDNSGGATTLNFDPANFVLQNTLIHFDSSLQIYRLLGSLAVQPATVVAGQNLTLSPARQGALVVSTTATDGSVEANQTSYFLDYLLPGQLSDPFVKLVKSFAAGTPPWPNTEDCTTIQLH